MIVTLIGFMGSGKTTVGKLLAEKFKTPFIDIDKEVEKTLSLSIPEIFQKFGERFFRMKEVETFQNIVATFDNAVVSTGGGMAAFNNNIEILKENSITVYLKADFETLWNRIKDDPNRPLVKSGKNKLKELFEKRNPFYEMADIIIDTAGKTPKEIVEIIEGKLKKIYEMREI